MFHPGPGDFCSIGRKLSGKFLRWVACNAAPIDPFLQSQSIAVNLDSQGISINFKGCKVVLLKGCQVVAFPWIDDGPVNSCYTTRRRPRPPLGRHKHIQQRVDRVARGQTSPTNHPERDLVAPFLMRLDASAGPAYSPRHACNFLPKILSERCRPNPALDRPGRYYLKPCHGVPFAVDVHPKTPHPGAWWKTSRAALRPRSVDRDRFSFQTFGLRLPVTFPCENGTWRFANSSTRIPICAGGAAKGSSVSHGPASISASGWPGWTVNSAGSRRSGSLCVRLRVPKYQATAAARANKAAIVYFVVASPLWWSEMRCCRGQYVSGDHPSNPAARQSANSEGSASRRVMLSSCSGLPSPLGA